MTDAEYKYDVALSFAGEDREFVESVANRLKSKDIRVFYDKYEQTNLWGKDLYVHLDKIYRIMSRFCVIFISKYYKNKLWTNHERISAQARAFEENIEYILPFKLDDTDIPGIRPTVGYLSKKSISLEQLVDAIFDKVKSSSKDSTELKTTYSKDSIQSANSDIVDYFILYIESDKYSEDSFIFKRNEIVCTERQINITSKLDNKLIELLEKPKERSIDFAKSRWIKVFIENKLIIGLPSSLEKIPGNKHLLRIEITSKKYDSKFWNRSELSEIKKLLKYLLCNKLSDNETSLDNSLTKYIDSCSLRSSVLTYPSLSSSPICPIPPYYSLYLKNNNWIEFCLKAKAGIIERLEFLGLIDSIEKLEINRSESDEIEIHFSGILKLYDENIYNSRLTINEKCDLSSDNVHSFYESLKRE